MKNMKKILLTSLLAISVIPAFSLQGRTYSVFASTSSIEKCIRSLPQLLPNGQKTKVDGAYHYNPGDIMYYDIADYSEHSFCKTYGITSIDGDSCAYLGTPGGGYQTMMKFQNREHLAINKSEGVLMYFDASQVNSDGGKYIGLGIGMILMDSKVEPAGTSYLWERDQHGGHFSYYYLVDGRTAYYYDYELGEYVPTVCSKETVKVKEHFKGWIYMPFSSFGWNGQADSKYVMTTDAFDNGLYYVDYTHFKTSHLSKDDAQNTIYFDEQTYVSSNGSCAHSYSKVNTIFANCVHEGGDIYECSNCHNYYVDNYTQLIDHTYVDYYKVDNTKAFAKCQDCDHIEVFTDASIISLATLVDNPNHVEIRLHYGYEKDQTMTKYVIKGKMLPYRDSPLMHSVKYGEHEMTYDFLAWSNNRNIYTPVDPTNNSHNADTDYYAYYLLSSYDNIKYTHATNLLAMSGGTYHPITGKLVFNGNSNFSLAHTVEEDFAARGLPLINNSCAGGSTYDYLYYVDPLVIGFAPKILCFNLTTNDQAYWSMSEKDIANRTIEFIDYIHERLPNCVVAMVNSSPLPGRSEMFATASRLNKWAKEYAQKTDKVEFIDTYDFVYSRMKEYPAGWEFWTHMDTETLSTWMNLIADGLLEIVDRYGIRF